VAPWCLACGGDWKRAESVAPESSPAPEAGRPEVATADPGSASAANASEPFSDEELAAPFQDQPRLARTVRAAHDEEFEDRFGLHNTMVGLAMAVWGFCRGSVRGDSGAERVLNAAEWIDLRMDAVGYAMTAVGLLLFVSGLGMKWRKAWGPYLAGFCALVMVGGIAVLLWTMAETGNPTTPAGRKPTVKESVDDLAGAVAKWYLLRENFDLLLGSADAVGILFFLRRRRTLELP
jgi:hypothetical protein